MDIAALSDTLVEDEAVHTLAQLDDFYADQRGSGDGISTQVARQLADPQPLGRTVTGQSRQYKGLLPRMAGLGIGR